MESRLPKRKIAVAVNDRANRIAANHIKFGESFPRAPLAMVNPDNPPLYQSMRQRAVSPDPRPRRIVDLDRQVLRRSRSISDLSHAKLVPLKRGATGTIESIPAKIARVNIAPKPAGSSISVAKPVTNGVGLKATTSGISSSFKRPAKPATAVAPTVKSMLSEERNYEVFSNVNFLFYIETTAAASAAVAKVAVKRIPSYDYKARFNDLTEKHKTLREKYALVETKVEDAERMEQEVAALQEEVRLFD